MLIIKRYPNRKLYDTAARQYIALERVAGLIRAGAAIQVQDHATGEDLTTLVLTQIIVEQEKQQAGFLPLAVLTGLVQAGGHTLAALRRGLAAPLDLVRQVDEEIARRVDRLVEIGELTAEEGGRLASRLQAVGPAGSPGELPGLAAIERALAGRGLPTRAEYQTLVAQVDALGAELETLRQDREGLRLNG